MSCHLKRHPIHSLRSQIRFGSKFDIAGAYVQTSLTYAGMGELDLAREYAVLASQSEPEDQQMQANSKAILSAVDLSLGNNEKGARQFEESAGLFEKSLQPEGVAAMHYNRAVTSTLQGDFQAAGKQFELVIAQSSRVLPKWQVTQMLNPGASSITRPLGEGTLPILLKDKEGKWVETSIPRKDVELEKRGSLG